MRRAFILVFAHFCFTFALNLVTTCDALLDIGISTDIFMDTLPMNLELHLSRSLPMAVLHKTIMSVILILLFLFWLPY